MGGHLFLYLPRQKHLILNMDHEKILKEFIRRVWNEKEISAVPEFEAPDYTEWLDRGDTWEGRTLDNLEFITRLRYSFDSFPDIHFKIHTAIADEDHVAIGGVLTGTHKGPIGAFPPTGLGIEAPGMTGYHFSKGLISGHHQVFDRTMVARQLGFLKKQP
jgi:predicted ester cyclase